MYNLEDIRIQIDEVDKELLKLFIKRMELSEKVGEYKIINNIKVFNEDREQEVIESRKKFIQEEKWSNYIEEFFKLLMTLSRRRQYSMCCEKEKERENNQEKYSSKSQNSMLVYQGVPGSYSYEAMKAYFGEDVSSVNVDSFEEVLLSLKENKAEYGILPIENSYTGSVTETYDLLMKYECYIIGEYILKVDHNLLGVPGSSLDSIKTVYSHAQGLMQCSNFLKSLNNIETIPVSNTAVGAKSVFEWGDISKAAIASKSAAKEFGLQILAENINNKNDNYTRFIIISSKEILDKCSNKISIVFSVPHKKGYLYAMLSHIAYNNLNMIKIESRPMKDRNWEYMFFVDFQGNPAHPDVKNALEGIKNEAGYFKLLGSYRSELI